MMALHEKSGNNNKLLKFILKGTEMCVPDLFSNLRYFSLDQNGEADKPTYCPLSQSIHFTKLILKIPKPDWLLWTLTMC